MPALERDVRKGSRHPHVERIMQRQIRQDELGSAVGAYNTWLNLNRRDHDIRALHELIKTGRRSYFE
jgi:hypothetical protein